MKGFAVFATAAVVFGLGVLPARAQNHAEVGAFADYFRLNQTDTNFVGLGGRFAINATKHVQLEAEMNYDFDRPFSEGFQNSSGGAVVFQQSDVRILHGLFGPKIQTGGRVRAFVTLKGGFINFRFDPEPPSFNTFTSSVSNLRASDVSGVLYPGGGLETFLGPFGLRVEVGDEIYFSNGARNNWRITFGPTIRF